VTSLVACIGCALALLFASFAASLGAASSADIRAQTAADAAALAAVAESAPHGRGAPQDAARRFAQLNDARLESCVCPPGSTSAQVSVVHDGVVARARAVLDVSLLAPASTAFDEGGLDPALRDAVERLVSAAGGAVRVVSGYRSFAEQARLWADALRRYGSPEAADDWVAPPGSSMHERGLAVDLGGDLDRAVALVEELALPLHRPLGNEPWHFELVGSRG
jgi:Flp pilus assembly protein TadG